MKYKALILCAILALTGCSLTPQKAPICSGNLLRGCQPIVYFDLNSTKLSAETKQNLNWATSKMKRWPSKHIKLTCHADWHGEPDKNLNLSKNRALAVKNYMVKRGINADRIVIEFKGETNPVCYTASCQHLNRRVEGNLDALTNRTHKMHHEMKSGFASLATMSALVPNARVAGDTQISVGAGHYRGTTGFALGAFHHVNDNVNNLASPFDTEGGVSYLTIPSYGCIIK